MKNKFFWRLQPDKKFFDELWQNATFVFDTNILLSMYRAKKETFNDIRKVLDAISKRIWLPYNVADEYFKNREKTIRSERASFSDAIEILDEWENESKNFDKLKGRIEQVGRLIPKEIEGLYSEQKKYFQEVEKVVQNFKTKIGEIEDDHLPDNEGKDEILNYLLNLFDNKVGEPFENEDLEYLKKEGKDRFEKGIPPGYKDFSKEENEFGDFIIWKQILSYSKKNKVPIVLVTDDRKEDWWKIQNNEIKSPHPLLRKEFFEETTNHFWMYRLEKFLEYAKDKFDLEISDKSIEESGELSDLYPFEEAFKSYFKTDQDFKAFHKWATGKSYETEYSKNTIEMAIDNLIDILVSLSLEDLTTFYSKLSHFSASKVKIRNVEVDELVDSLDHISESQSKKLKSNINILRVSILDFTRKELFEFYAFVIKRIRNLQDDNRELILKLFGMLFWSDEILL